MIIWFFYFSQFEINLHLWIFKNLTCANQFHIELETVWLPILIIYMQKLLDCENCNTSASYTLWFWIIIDWKTIWNFLRQWHHIKWWQKFWADKKKMVSRRIFQHFFHANFLMFILLRSNHTVFLVYFALAIFSKGWN